MGFLDDLADLAEDEEGDEEFYEQFDLSRVTKIILYYDEDGNAQAEYIY